MKYSIIGILIFGCSLFGHIDLEADHDIHQRISQLLSFDYKSPIPGVTLTESHMSVSGKHAPHLITSTDKVLTFFSVMESGKIKGENVKLYREMLERGLPISDFLLLMNDVQSSVDIHIEKMVKGFALKSVDAMRAKTKSGSIDYLDNLAVQFIHSLEAYENSVREDLAVEKLSAFSPHGQLVIMSFIDEFFVPGMNNTYLRYMDTQQIFEMRSFLFPFADKSSLVSEKYRYQKVQSKLNLSITQALVICVCGDPGDNQNNGTFGVWGRTSVRNPDYLTNRLHFFTVARHVITTNVAAFQLEEFHGSESLYTIAIGSSNTIVQPGIQRATGRHEGFENRKAEFPNFNINGEKAVTSASDSCVVRSFIAPTDDECQPGGGGGRILDKGLFDDSCVESPLVIDLDQDGFEFSPPGVGAYFDILGHGRPIFIQWLKPHGDDALLALDLNENGMIDSGRELFGEGTQLILRDRIPADHGYQALAQYDKVWLGGNQDGVISQEDEIWHRLLLWHDFDGDGYSDPGEVEYLSTYGQWRLPLVFKKSRMTDEAGNQLRYWSWIYDEHMPFKTRMVDVFFKRIQSP